jgi:hypothetical protein
MQVSNISFTYRHTFFVTFASHIHYCLAIKGTLWNVGSITKSKVLNRAIFLETIAAIPGMVAAIIRVRNILFVLYKLPTAAQNFS